MMGAALSTAFYEKARKREPAPVCVWCGKGEPAHWVHLAPEVSYLALAPGPRPQYCGIITTVYRIQCPCSVCR